MKRFLKPKPERSSPLADFIRDASSGEKKRVYRGVLERATKRQLRTLEQASVAYASTGACPPKS